MASNVPKHPALRQRRNRTSTNALLPSPESMAENPVPDLPKRDNPAENWHPRTLEWWRAVWTSPMAAEYLDSDVRGGLFQLAELHQLFWTASDRSERLKAAAEIRLQEVRFGLSPIDRRRLQWEVARGESAQDRLESRRKARELPVNTGKDPRDVLKVVGS